MQSAETPDPAGRPPDTSKIWLAGRDKFATRSSSTALLLLHAFLFKRRTLGCFVRLAGSFGKPLLFLYLFMAENLFSLRLSSLPVLSRVSTFLGIVLKGEHLLLLVWVLGNSDDEFLPDNTSYQVLMTAIRLTVACSWQLFVFACLITGHAGRPWCSCVSAEAHRGCGQLPMRRINASFSHFKSCLEGGI